MFEKSESAPVSAVLKKLLEGKKITTEQQMQVIEHWREILVRCMKTFSQKTLGQLACLDSGDGSVHELYKDKPRVVSSGNMFSLDSRGFFAGNLFSCGKNGQRFAFGIDDESWLLINVSYFCDENPSWKYERAAVVQVICTDLQTILEEMEIDTRLVWSYFRIVMVEWLSHRKELYNQARKVAGGFREQDMILNLIT